jgi:hypothetical protein
MAGRNVRLRHQEPGPGLYDTPEKLQSNTLKVSSNCHLFPCRSFIKISFTVVNNKRRILVVYTKYCGKCPLTQTKVSSIQEQKTQKSIMNTKYITKI